MEFIKNITDELINKYSTNNPFEIICESGAELIFNYEMVKLKGFYSVVKNKRYIVINGNLEDEIKKIVAAHELGHDLLHRRFAVDNAISEINLFDLSSRKEYEANIFSAELLISDEEVIKKGEYLSDAELSMALKTDKSLLHIKIQSMINRGFDINFLPDINNEFLQ